MGEIANDELREDQLPSRSDDQLAWISFALTFDGYAEKSGFEKCAAFAKETREGWKASGTLPPNLSDLRAALYFEQRRWRHSEENPFTEGEWAYWHALVDSIGDAIAEHQGHPRQRAAQLIEAPRLCGLHAPHDSL